MPRSQDQHGTFGRRLALAFAVVAALTALAAGIMITVVFNYQFDAYAKENLLVTARTWAQTYSLGYENRGGWGAWLVEVPRFGIMRGQAIQLCDASGKPLQTDIGVNRIYGQSTDLSSIDLKGQRVTVPVESNGQIVGYVHVWSPGNTQLLSEVDQRFRRSSFLGLFIAAIGAVVLASVGGLWYSNRMVKPIERITETALALRAGDADARVGVSGDDEIGYLAQTFDEMADAIQADREMERQLTSDVAHELRTPLQAIQATVEAMQDGVLPADEERLGVVRDETVRLARLADAIMELTRLERGSLPFDMRAIDFAEPVRAALDTHSALFETCDLTLTSRIAEGLRVQGDADRLQQAVGNLLGNAARYTPAGGSVDVELARVGDRAVLRVSDTGVGIAEEDLDRVFGRFWRADSARDRASGGLGVGLAVTREIVERHKGAISASRRDGGGSVFEISVPLAG